MALVTEAVASSIIEKLMDTVLDHARLSRWPSARSVKAETEKLNRAVPRIGAILDAAAQRDLMKQRNPRLDLWVWQFRDALEAADDVLDEIEYYELEEQIKARDNMVSGLLSSCKRKLADFVKYVFVNDEILEKLREAVKGLEVVASDADTFLQLANGPNQELIANNFREAGLFSTERRIVGRGTEKEIIVRWLMAEPDGDEQGLLSVFSIVGIGGMGKTTLAQHVCKDQRVTANFDLIVWVCVSDNCGIVDAKTVIKKIIEDTTRMNCSLDNLNTLQCTLQEIMTCKKFLLVLDDVWRDDKRMEWGKIVAPLRSCERGSKILLTTRMDLVAKMVARVTEGESKSLNLTGLEENDFMTLFYRHAFAGTHPSEHQNLHEIGNKIAKKLRACPLAAKVIGGVLNNSFTVDYWNKILSKDILDMPSSEDNIMGILELSYIYLPMHLQLCFRFCSIFPQDYKFRKVELVKMWMGSGLIPWHVREKRKGEDAADEYLDHLTKKSFFSIEPNIDPDMSVYCIHDLLHDLARCVSGGECLRITCNNSVPIPRTIRHLFIELENFSMLKEIRNLSKLKTLIITCSIQHSDAEQELNASLSETKSLRVLKLVIKTVDKIPNSIKGLIHLRYLEIQASWTSREQFICFLKSLHKLYYLEVMDVHNYT
ncbi:hypothetical protein LUZ60_002563 [Juncus effusus]|nr:hypothetical protein LUZ60_002563 [Juncus effusus]